MFMYDVMNFFLHVNLDKVHLQLKISKSFPSTKKKRTKYVPDFDARITELDSL